MVARQLQVSPAEQRLDRVLFGGRDEYDEHVVHVAAYRCPHCGRETEFNSGTLRKAQQFDGSPLGSQWHSSCEAIRPLGDWEWALDFECPQCRCPVRIVFTLDEEFAMGAYKNRLVQVIEARTCCGGIDLELTA